MLPAFTIFENCCFSGFSDVEYNFSCEIAEIWIVSDTELRIVSRKWQRKTQGSASCGHFPIPLDSPEIS